MSTHQGRPVADAWDVGPRVTIIGAVTMCAGDLAALIAEGERLSGGRQSSRRPLEHGRRPRCG